jgi:glycine cleavage system H lipoate-binding protein
MNCPFLREAQVKYCRAASVRKLIPVPQSGRREEKCSSPDYLSCKVYQAQAAGEEGAASCPCLCESLMQYCGAAPVAKFVPYSESLLSRCGNDGYRYCELYLSMAHPMTTSEEVEGISLPDWLGYSANHMWLDVTDDGTCHAGIDAFLTRVLGKIDRIAYVWQKGVHRPTAILTAGGTDFDVVFPNEMLLTACNLYLRADPSHLAAAPYTGGWLFEGKPEPGTLEGVRRGAEARQWMEQELHRINQFLQEGEGAGKVAADGGQFSPGLVSYLERDQILALFHEFFSPYANAK